MKIFLIGRDSSLSNIEIDSYLKVSNFSYKIIKKTKNYIQVDFKDEEKIDFSKIINELGSFLRVIDFITKTDRAEENILERYEVFLPKKHNFALSSINLNFEEQGIIKNYLKNTLSSKAVLKKSNKNIVSPKNFHSWGLQNGLELFCIKEGSSFIFGRGIASTDPRNYKKRDTNRPSRVFTHGTSIRTAQIMVNMLGLKKGLKIVDPFCGTGTFLIESLIKGYDVVGIDNDSEFVNFTKKNVIWAKKEYNLNNNSEIFLGDSRKIKLSADSSVFEPYMGPFLKNLPTKNEALKIKQQLEALYFKVFKNLYNCLSSDAKIVCILPDFITNKFELVQINRNVFIKNNFKRIYKEIPYESVKGSRIKRNIYVLQKFS